MSEELDQPLTPGERRALERQIDRIEERLHVAPPGLHVGFAGAGVAALEAAGLPEAAAMLWARWDGMDLGHGEACIHPLAEIEAETEKLFEEERGRPGDRAIGVYGRDDMVLPADPWEEGADVVLVDEAGQRGPYASTVPALILGLLAEFSVLLDDGGEYHEELFDEETGELTVAVERRLLRRRLDADEDAPLARFRLAQLLRRGGETKAARRELELCLRRAPNFAWAHFELGRAQLELGAAALAAKAFDAALEGSEDPDLQAYFAAWAALASEGESRRRYAARVLELSPGFVRAQEAGAREAIEDEVPGRARELIALGLAVSPQQLGLLDLRKQLG